MDGKENDDATQMARPGRGDPGDDRPFRIHFDACFGPGCRLGFFAPPPAGDKHGPRPGGFEKDDVNKDGQVTRAEFSGPKEMFSRLDANGDGVITREEVKAKKPPTGQPNPPEPPSN